MVKILSQAFGGGSKSNKNTIKVNEMAPEKAVSSLNNFFGGNT